MNNGRWYRYISIYTTTSIDIESGQLVSSLEKAFEANGLAGPYNTETNAPGNPKNAPIVKVETNTGMSGVWIGDHLIFVPVEASDYEKMIGVLGGTELAAVPARSYSLNSSKQTVIEDEVARQTVNPEVLELLNDNKAKEFSKDVTKQLSDTLVAKDIITIARRDPTGLTVDMAIAIDSTDVASGQTVGDLLSHISFSSLKAHEDEIEQQANSIVAGR